MLNLNCLQESDQTGCNHIRVILETAKVKPMLDQLELHVGYMQEYTLAYLAKEEILPRHGVL